MTKGLGPEQMAKRAAQELRDGNDVNLGASVASLVASFIPPGGGVVLQGENGLIDVVAPALKAEVDAGGHIAVAIVGALQVSEKGDLSSGTVPDRMPEGMAGAMDLVASARRVVVVMAHAKDGAPGILKECSLPLTGQRVAHRIITDLAVIDVTPEGLVLKEVAPGVSAREVQDHTEPTLKVGPDLSTIAL
jgi:3-oxoacid CoA-transferase subunit B